MNRRYLAPIAIVFCIALAAGAARRLVGNTINPVAAVSHDGRRINLTGPFTCTQTEWVTMRVTVTQRTTGAMAEGFALRLGSTSPQEWQVTAFTRGSASFEPGPATAVAVAVTSLHGESTDAHQWLVPVTLQEE